MPKYLVFCQFVARAVNHNTWNIPRIRDGDRWRPAVHKQKKMDDKDDVGGLDGEKLEEIYCWKLEMCKFEKLIGCGSFTLNRKVFYN